MTPAALSLPCGTLRVGGRVRAVVLPSMVTRRGDAIVAAALVAERDDDGRVRFRSVGHDCRAPFDVAACVADRPPPALALANEHMTFAPFMRLVDAYRGHPASPKGRHLVDGLVSEMLLCLDGSGPQGRAVIDGSDALLREVVACAADAVAMLGSGPFDYLAGTLGVLPWSPDAWAGIDPEAGDAPLGRALSLLPEHAAVLVDAYGNEPEAFDALRDRRGTADYVLSYLVGLRAFPRRMAGALAGAAAAHATLSPDDARVALVAAGNRSCGPGLPVAACHLLARLPGNWRPRGEAEWKAMMRLVGPLAWAACKCDDDGHLAAFVRAGKGWVDLESRLARAAGADRPPVPVVAEDGTGDVVAAFVSQVVVPARFLAEGRGRDEAARVPDEKAHEATAFAMLFHGRSLVRVLSLSRDWHARQGAMLGRLSALGGGPSSWEAALPSMDVGCLRVEVLSTSAQLAWEGARGRDAQGVRGLSHCVGQYVPQSLSGLSRIVSVRRPLPDGTFERLSTAELRWDGIGIAAVQHRGAGNGEPPPEAIEALGAYLRAVAADTALAGPAIRSPRPLGAGVPLAVACGYDWSAPGHWETARDLWAGFMPRPMRAMDARAFITALGSPMAMAKWLPDRFAPHA